MLKYAIARKLLLANYPIDAFVERIYRHERKIFRPVRLIIRWSR